jgi:hypothetical protein
MTKIYISSSIEKGGPMSEKEFNLLMELANQKLQQEVSKEEALRSLVNAGILDANGNLTKPYEDLAVDIPQ